MLPSFYFTQKGEKWMKYAKINFQNSLKGGWGQKEYTFKCLLELENPTLVVVETSQGLGVGKFIGYVDSIDFDASKLRWVIGAVDIKAHNKAVKNYEAAQALLD